jgi:hypothetical protein
LQFCVPPPPPPGGFARLQAPNPAANNTMATITILLFLIGFLLAAVAGATRLLTERLTPVRRTIVQLIVRRIAMKTAAPVSLTLVVEEVENRSKPGCNGSSSTSPLCTCPVVGVKG